MKISIVIPNFNGENLLRTNLPKVIEAIKNYKDEKEIIVADDTSIDESRKVVEEIKKENKDLKITFLSNSKNLGFSSNVNRAVKKTTGEILILLNTDVYPKDNFLTPLLSHFKNKNVFAVGCLERSIESDGNVVLRGRGEGSWKRGFLVHKKGEVNKESTLWVSGGSGAFRREIWEKLNGFNNLYDPFYWEDIDLSYRALKSGYGILFEPESLVVHEHEKGAIKSRYSQSKIKSIVYRNQFIFVWENATDYFLRFSHFFWLPYYFVKALLSSDWAFFIGFSNALILLPKVITSSLNLKKTFIKKDKEVIEGLG